MPTRPVIRAFPATALLLAGSILAACGSSEQDPDLGPPSITLAYPAGNPEQAQAEAQHQCDIYGKKAKPAAKQADPGRLVFTCE